MIIYKQRRSPIRRNPEKLTEQQQLDLFTGTGTTVSSDIPASQPLSISCLCGGPNHYSRKDESDISLLVFVQLRFEQVDMKAGNYRLW